MSNIVSKLSSTIAGLQEALNEEIDKKVLADYEDEDLNANMAARYWLMQFLEPLSRKELKSVVDGFLIQLLNDEQSKKLVKFLLLRFPDYYREELEKKEDRYED
jgi:hypothetical protein